MAVARSALLAAALDAAQLQRFQTLPTTSTPSALAHEMQRAQRERDARELSAPVWRPKLPN
jgi:hypothetical protein